MPAGDDLRAELASVAGSLRAYLEVQADSGATGIPRGRRAPAVASTPTTTPSPTPSPTTTTSTTATATSTPTRPLGHGLRPSGEASIKEEAAPTLAAPLRGSELGASTTTLRLPILEREVATCTRCDLHSTRKQTVFSRGNPAAPLVFIGEAPGADEDEQGLPFVGRAGQLLDRMIGAMGLSPASDVYVCNIIKCRPPANRKPTPEETDTCIPYLHEQLALIKPKVIVALGNTAAGALLGTKLGITKIRGEWKLYRGTTLVMPTYHPSFLLRPSPQQTDAKRHAWEDLQAVMTELKLPMPKKGGPA